MIRRIAAIIILHVWLNAMPQAAIGQEEPDAPTARMIGSIITIVNDDPISVSDVRQRVRLLLFNLGGQQPTQEQFQQLTNQALNQLIDEKLQLQKAAEYEVEIAAADVDKDIENRARSLGLTRESLFDMFLQAGINPAGLEDQIRADIAWRRIMRGLYGKRIRVSDNQIDEHLSHFKLAARKEQYQVSEIFLYAPTNDDKVNTLVAANSIIEQLNAGTPFEIAAQRFSSAPTAATGGDMGWITLDDLDPDRRAAIEMVQDTGLAPPIQSENGVYILLVRDRREPSSPQTFVDLNRIIARDGSEATLQAAIDQISDCNTIDRITISDDALDTTRLEDMDTSTFKPEIKSMIAQTPTGGHTPVIRQSGQPAVFYVCKRQTHLPNIPSRDQVEERLLSQQFGLVAERSLRNLRREATIIYR